jgi:hypothetical protein
MKDKLLNVDSQNPTCCTGWDNCCNIIAIQRHDFAWAIHQVCTLSWNQTCWLDVKFMQHCCTWTIGDLFMWYHHKWTSVCLCMFHAIKLWSSSCTLVHLNCQQYVVIQQQLLTEELFSQLLNCVLLLCHHISKWSIGIRPTSRWTQFELVKKEYHPSHLNNNCWLKSCSHNY